VLVALGVVATMGLVFMAAAFFNHGDSLMACLSIAAIAAIVVAFRYASAKENKKGI
jgi:tellurite resistance protein TehA-like permease